jgi:aminobenzoyl-glutamate utilization protein B
MNMMVNMMREHVDQESRIHYIISSGGLAPNVVPDFAEVRYMIRHPDITELKGHVGQDRKSGRRCRNGYRNKGRNRAWRQGLYGLLPNETLAKQMHKNLSSLGGVEYDAEETKWATEIQKTFNSPTVPSFGSRKKSPALRA